MVNPDFDSIPDSSNMADLPEEALSPRQYQPGEVVEGEVVRVDDEGIVVSVGLKMEGIVLAQDMRSLTQGTGKSTLFAFLAKLFGKKNVMPICHMIFGIQKSLR